MLQDQDAPMKDKLRALYQIWWSKTQTNKAFLFKKISRELSFTLLCLFFMLKHCKQCPIWGVIYLVPMIFIYFLAFNKTIVTTQFISLVWIGSNTSTFLTQSLIFMTRGSINFWSVKLNQTQQQHNHFFTQKWMN